MQAVIILMRPDHSIFLDQITELLEKNLDRNKVTPHQTIEFDEKRCQQIFFETEQDLMTLQKQLCAVINPYKIDVAVLPAENRRKKLLISDMDSTMIHQECIDELADFIGKKSEISAITESAMRGDLDFEQSLTQRVALLKGLDESQLETCFQERITFMEGAKTLVNYMRLYYGMSILVSGGFTFFAEKIASHLGFNAYFANQLCFDEQNKLDGTVTLPILGRDTKGQILSAEAQKHNIHLSECLAVGDGANDLAMIQAAGLGVAYHAKPKVAEAARVAIHFCDLRALIYLQI